MKANLNLQSDQQGPCQRNCVLIMRFTSKTIENTGVENEVNGFENEQKTWRSKAGLFLIIIFLVIRKFIDFMSLFRHSVWFSFSVKQFPFAEFGICNI